MAKKVKKEEDEVKFEKWELLSNDAKQHVIQFLEFKTRFSLSICSKANYAIVKKTPQYVHSVKIYDNDHIVDYGLFFAPSGNEGITVTVAFDEDPETENKFETNFSQSGKKEKDTLIRWSPDGNKKGPFEEQILKGWNHHDAAAKYAESWMKKGNFKLSSLTVRTNNDPYQGSIIKKLPFCKHVKIRATDEGTMKWWLQKVANDIDYLELNLEPVYSDDCKLSTEFVQNPFFLNAKVVKCGGVRMSDEQLLQLKARKIDLGIISGVTDNGINAFLKKWVHGDYGENFCSMKLFDPRSCDMSAIISGLAVRRWDRKFKKEAKEFTKSFKQKYGKNDKIFQIPSKKDPYLSLTLCISDVFSVNIFWTGRKTELDGKIFTTYTMP